MAKTTSFRSSSVEASEHDALGLVAAASDEQQAEAVAEEIAALLASGATVRDRETGVRRAVRPGDIAILFRTREGHRLFEDALARRRVPFYVYKGLGFFDADEIKDVLALLGVSRAAAVGAECRGVPAIAIRPAVGRGAEAAGAAACRRL